MEMTDIDHARRRFFESLTVLPPPAILKALDNFPHLSPSERRQIEGQVRAALDTRRSRVERYAKQQFDTLAERVEQARAEADDIVDGLANLVEETEAGRVDLAGFQQRYAEMERRLKVVQGRLDSLRGGVDSLRDMDDDPEAYVQMLERKYPHLRRPVLTA